MLGVPAERVRTVYLGVPPLHAGARLRPGLPEWVTSYILAIGTVEPRKDLPTLVRAFGRVAGGRSGLALVIAGSEGWGGTELDEAVAACPARDRVLRLGWVDDEARDALTTGATVFAYPSRYEGFGLPPLHAMSAGAPVVAGDCGALREVLGERRPAGAPRGRRRLGRRSRRPSRPPRPAPGPGPPGARTCRPLHLGGLRRRHHFSLPGGGRRPGRSSAGEVTLDTGQQRFGRIGQGENGGPLPARPYEVVPGRPRTAGPVHGLGHLQRVFVVQYDPRAPERLGHCRRPVGHHRYAELHRLQHGDAEALVLGQAHEDVGHGPVGEQLSIADAAQDLHAVAQVQFAYEALHRRQVVRRRPAPHQGQVSIGVEDPAVDGERADDVVLALVGRHPPDEKPLRPLPPSAQPVERRPVRRAVVLLQVHQDRAHEGAFVAAVDQLFFVVGRIGEGEGGVGGQHVQLLASVVHGQGDVRLPPGEVRGGRDVVVVTEQLLAGPGLYRSQPAMAEPVDIW